MERDHMFGRGLADGGGGDSAGRQPLPDSDDSLLHHHKRRDGEAALQGSPPVSATQQRDHLDASQAKQLPLHAPPSYARFPEPASKPPPSQSQSQSQHAIPFASGGLAPALPPIKSLADHNSDDGLRHTTTLPSFAALAASATSSSSQAPLARSPPAGTAANTTTESSSYAPPQQRPPIAHWPSLNPFTAYYAPSYVQSAAPAAADSPSSSNKIDIEMNGAAGGGAPAPNPASPDRFLDGRSSSVSLDDPDVRLAAEALGDLKADFVSSPPKRSTPLPNSPSSTHYASPQPSVPPPPASQPKPEPLLSLLTMSHPLIYTTVESATSAYNSSKNFSPRFKSGAEYVEGYLTPLANTVGNISRVTGVEGSVRWFLSGSAARRKQQQPADLEAGTGGEGASHKRRKVEPASAGEDEKHLKDLIKAPPAVFDAYAPAHPRDRRLSTTSSIDTLPVYDDSRSPAYEAVATAGDVKMTDAPAPQREGGQVANVPQQPQAWQARLVMSTSGLSIAMSEESLRSLKYCLSWLRWANDHMATAIGKLKTTIEQYDRSEAAAAAAAAAASSTNGDALLRPQSGGHDEEKQPLTASRDPQNPTPAQQPSQPEPDRTALVGFMVALRDDLMRTLKETIDTVSRYAGGALPENASTLVRRHLTSLPQRFRLAALREQELREQQQQHQRQQQGSCDTPGATMLPGRSSGDFQRRKDKEVRDAAQRVVLLAKEAVDMMAQVSGVLDGTIQSAEEWCDRLGRSKRRREGEGEPERDAGGQSGGAMTAAPVGGEGERRDGDVNMS